MLRASCGVAPAFPEADIKSHAHAHSTPTARRGLPSITALNANLLRRSHVRQSVGQSGRGRQSQHLSNEGEGTNQNGSVVYPSSRWGSNRLQSAENLPAATERTFSIESKASAAARRKQSVHSDASRHRARSGSLDEIRAMLMQLHDSNESLFRRQESQISELHEQHFDRLATLLKDTFQQNEHASCLCPTEQTPSTRSCIHEDRLAGLSDTSNALHNTSEIDGCDIKCDSDARSLLEEASSCPLQRKSFDTIIEVSSNGNEGSRPTNIENETSIERRNRLAFSSHPAPKEDAPVCWQAPKVLRLAVKNSEEKTWLKDGSSTNSDEMPIGRPATEPFSVQAVKFAEVDAESSQGFAEADSGNYENKWSSHTQINGFGPLAMAMSEAPLELSDQWMDTIHALELNYVSMRRQTLSASVFAQAMEGAGFVQEDNIWGSVFGDPYSFGNTGWSVVCLLAVISDLIMIPFQLFDFKENSFTETLLLGTTIFWTIDFILSFFKGYFEDGTAITNDIRKMAWRYLRTWFAMDLVIITGDWMFFISVTIVNYQSDNISFWRALRVARLLRMLRLKKFLKRIEIYVGSKWSSHVLAYFTVMKFIIGIIVCNHLVACVFYGICAFGKTETTWVSIAGLRSADVDAKYIAAFHWSLAHFTGGEVDIIVQNSMERIYACLVLVCGLVLVSWLVSTTTNAMLLLAEVDQHKRKQITLIRQFCKQYQLEKGLCYRIQRYVKFAYEEKRQQMLLHEVEAFALLSEPLLAEIYHTIYSPCISGPDGHPLFQKIHRKAPTVMNKICRNAVALSGLAGGDCAFAPGELARRMYFILNGKFMYRQQGRGTFELFTNHWLGEAALWTTSWTHRGELQAKVESDLLMVDAEEFALTVRTHPRTYIWVQQYARRYVNEMNLSNASTDMDVSSEDFNKRHWANSQWKPTEDNIDEEDNEHFETKDMYIRSSFVNDAD